MSIKKKLGILLIIVIVLVFLNFVPTFNLKISGMNKLTGNEIDLYYQKEEEAALDVLELADNEAANLSKQLGLNQKQDVSIYVYDQQTTMQQKKYGLIGPLLGLDWYIGDNKGTNVLLTSPANPGKSHDYDSVKFAVLHELVHAYVSIINPNVSLWLNEGLALYLSNGEPFYKDNLEWMAIPTYSQTRTQNPITFSNSGGYQFAHTYIEYLEINYGWDTVIELLKSGDYQGCFNQSEQEIYDEWVYFLKDYYQ